MCGLGVIRNIINIIVFSNEDLKEDIYSYLFFYSLSNCVYTLLTSFGWLSRSGIYFAYSSSYESKFYEIYFFFTGLYGLGTLSAFIEIAITFDRLLLMKQIKLKTKLPPRLIVLLMLIVSMLVSSIYSTIREIKPTVASKTKLNQTITTVTYAIIFNEFGSSLDGQLLYLIITVLRNIGTIFLLGVLNILLTIEIQKFYNRKMHLLKSNLPTTMATDLEEDKKLKKQEISNSHANYAKMTLFLFIIYVTGNIMNAVIGVCFIYYSTHGFFSYALAFGDFPQFLSYGVNIFIYYNFNSRYKKIFLQYMSRIGFFKKSFK